MRMKRIKSLAIPLLVFCGVLVLTLVLINGVSGKQSDAAAKLCADSVRRAALTCYSVEGRYPMSLDYLKENYGVIYDEEALTVFYDAFASNVMPDIEVIRAEEVE